MATTTRVLVVVTTDIMPWVLLKPWLTGLRDAGFEVHIACSRGPYFEPLAGEGFAMHEIALSRSFNPCAHLPALFRLCGLLRRHKFDVLNTHSPVAAAVGRLAGWATGTGPRIYTVHGFYFHDRMPWVQRWPLQSVEWLLGRITDQFMFVSEEDRQTALRVGIVRREQDATTIRNGVALSRFTPLAASAVERLEAKKELGLGPRAAVVGIVGRIVREKGYREFLGMARAVASAMPDAAFLVVGDTLKSDRDQFGASFREMVNAAGLTGRFVFTGFTTEVPKYLGLMDIFVLPSYREGLPCSVIEAMAAGLPVVTTDIRGCREAAIHGRTGIVVPPKDAVALTDAVLRLLNSPADARCMGAAGRERAERLYDEKIVQQRFIAVFDSISGNPAARDKAVASHA
jgi:glycosyltransferase involved in cell wall biosynthesis